MLENPNKVQARLSYRHIPKRCRKIRHSMIMVYGDTLEKARDLYTMSFEHCSVKKGIRVIARHESIYADMMHKLIEDETGLRTSLELVRG